MKKKSDEEDKKSNNGIEPLLGFLKLLNYLSVSADISEFCTPGHKAGRGFAAIWPAEPVSLSLTLPEEVRHEV